MVLLIVIILITFLLFMNIYLETNFSNNCYQFKLIILKVIKISVKANNKVCKKKRTAKQITRRVNYSAIPKTFSECVKPMANICSKIHLTLHLVYEFGLPSPDNTAILFGIINTLVYEIHNILKGIFKNYQAKYDIAPNFKECLNKYSVNMSIRCRLFFLIIFSIKMAIILYKNKTFIKDKGGVLNVGTSNRRVNEDYNG